MTETNHKKFRLHWLGGKTEVISGTDITDAFRRAGYGGGSIRALDYYDEIEPVTPDKKPTLA